MAATDGEVRPVERQFVRVLCEELDVQGDPFERIGRATLFELCERFRTNRSRRIALMELIRAANVDGEFHSSERQSLRVIGELMDLDEAAVTSLEEWIERGLAWRREGETLLDA